MKADFLILNVILLLATAFSQDSLRTLNESFMLQDDESRNNETFYGMNSTDLHQNVSVGKISLKSDVGDEYINKTAFNVKSKLDDSFTSIESNSDNNNTSILMPFQNNIFKLIDHLSINIGKITFGGLQNVIRGKYVINPMTNIEKDSTFVNNSIVDLEDVDSSNTTDGSGSQDSSDISVMPVEVFLPAKPQDSGPLEARSALRIAPMPPPPPPSSSPSYSVFIKEENHNDGGVKHNQNNEFHENQKQDPFRFPQVPPLDDIASGQDNEFVNDDHHNHHHHHKHHHHHHRHHHHHHSPSKNDNSTTSSSTSTSTATTTTATTSTDITTVDTNTTTAAAVTTTTTAATATATAAVAGKRNLRKLQSTMKTSKDNVVGQDKTGSGNQEQDERDDDIDEIEEDLAEDVETDQIIDDSNDDDTVVDAESQTTVPMVTLKVKGVKYCGKEGGGINDLGDLSLRFSDSIGKLLNVPHDRVLVVKMNLINNSKFVDCSDKDSNKGDNKMDIKFTFLIDTNMEASFIFKELEAAANQEYSFLVEELGKIGFIQISKNIA